MFLRCGYCSFEDEREILFEAPIAETGLGIDDPYRDKPRTHARTAKLEMQLGALLPGRSVEGLDAAALRASCARRPLLDDDLASVEWERVWMAVWLAFQCALHADSLRARVALETTLLSTKTPAYRALLLAHLAQHAAALGATALAKKWLRACPDVAVAEVDSEIRAARALIALMREKNDEVRRKTGDTRAGAGFVGHAMFLAIALNVEAHERNGDRRLADAILADLKRKKLFMAVLLPMTAFKIGQRSLQRFTAKVRRNSALTSALIAWLLVLGVAALRPVGVSATLLAAAIAAGASGGLSWASFGVTTTLRWKKLAWVLVNAVIPFACIAIPMLWLVNTSRPQATPEMTAHAPSIASAVRLVAPPAPPDEGAMPKDDENEAALLRDARFAFRNERFAEAERLARACVEANSRNDACVSLLAETIERSHRPATPTPSE